MKELVQSDISKEEQQSFLCFCENNYPSQSQNLGIFFMEKSNKMHVLNYL